MTLKVRTHNEGSRSEVTVANPSAIISMVSVLIAGDRKKFENFSPALLLM